MYCLDGNSSLKRVLTSPDRIMGDTRVLTDSTYFLSREYVDEYVNEVKGRRTKAPPVTKKTSYDSSDSEADSEVGSEAGDLTDGLVVQAAPGDGDALPPSSPTSGQPSHGPEQPPTTAQDAMRAKILAECVKNWKAAAKDENKKMWSIFDESGIFASACRHGFILWVADMVRSGEL